MKHLCSTKDGSSGGPILYLQTYNVLGIHNGKKINCEWNIGTILKHPIYDFQKKYNIKAKQDFKIYYDLIEYIGSGGYGTVFKGKEKKTNEMRTIKVIDLRKIKESLFYDSEPGKIKDQLQLSINRFITEFEIMFK